MAELDRRCPRCETAKPIVDFHRRSNGGFQSYCIPCERVIHKERNARISAERAARRQLKQQARAHALSVIEERRRLAKERRPSRIVRQALERELLSDAYVKKLLTDRCCVIKVKASAISDELVALKRDHLQVLRLRRGVLGVLAEEVNAKPTAAAIPRDPEQRRLALNQKSRERYAGNDKEHERRRHYKARKREEARQHKASPAGPEVGNTTEGTKA